MRPLSLTKITTFWIYAYSLGKGLSYIMLLVIILSYALTYFIFRDTLSLLDVFLEYWQMFVIQQAVLLTTWVIAALYFKLFPIKKGRGAKWELNRQTGMVTVFKQEGTKEQKKRVAYSRPFYEFDAHLATLFTHYGFASYKLLLQRRYEDTSLGNFMDNPSNNKAVVYANWDFIQNYMDVTKSSCNSCMSLLTQSIPYVLFVNKI